MKILYRHISDPQNVKVYDTAVSLRRLKGTCFYNGQSQEEWDAQEVEHMRRDQERGIILEFKEM